MKFLNILPAALVLSVAGFATVGSMYVTVNAAVDADETAPVAADGSVPASQAAEGTAGVAAEPRTVNAEAARNAVNANDVVLGSGGTLSGIIGVVGTQGRLDPANGLSVTLVRSGQIVSSTVSSADGMYSFSGMTPGVYAIIARGSEGFSVFGFRAVYGAVGEEPTILYTAAARPRDAATIEKLIHDGASGVILSPPVAAEPDPSTSLVDPATTLRHHILVLNADGSLSGQIQILDAAGQPKPITSLVVSFVAGDSVLASAEVASDGSFSVTGVPSGVYSLAGVGGDGVLAVGVEVTDALSTAMIPGEHVAVNLIQTNIFTGMPAQAADYQAADVPPTDDTQPVAVPPAAPGGAVGGGSGGGGAGGGGGGGLGALLGAAIGAGIWAAADDDDDKFVPASGAN